MQDGTQYSQRLGRISDEQFEAAVSRAGLGRFLAAAPITSGLFGQNVFVTTSEGEFVLRGAPHWVGKSEGGRWTYVRDDKWQFAKELFFARQLHEQTAAPVPWPITYDERDDIFGWPYLLMPRMPGICFDERSVVKSVPTADRRAMAVALADMLATMQAARWPLAGDLGYGLTFAPYPHGYLRYVVDETRRLASSAQTNGAMEGEDFAWIEAVAVRATTVAAVDPITFVHGDYKLNNLALSNVGGSWRVTGIFDLHEAHFGDGAVDIIRQACSYIDTEPELARIFLGHFREAGTCAYSAARFSLYLANDRIKFWEYFTRPDVRADWTKGKSFRTWAGRYLAALEPLLW